MKTVVLALCLLPLLSFGSPCDIDPKVKSIVELIHSRSMPCGDVKDFLEVLDNRYTGDRIVATDVTCEIVKENLFVKNDFVNCPVSYTHLTLPTIE